MKFIKAFFTLLFLSFTANSTLAGEGLFKGKPLYADENAKTLVEDLIKAHGGAEAWKDVEALKFSIITKVIIPGTPTPQPPRYSTETVNLQTGAAYLDWPFWGSEIIFDGQKVHSKQWPLPLPPGFFSHLTFSFLTLPWLTQADGVRIGEIREKTLPGRGNQSLVIRLEFEGPNPNIPGNYYDLFINPETKLVEGVEFNITHPGMVAVDAQPIGPNYHIFLEHYRVGNAVIPAYYESYGSGAANNVDVGAIHIIFDVEAGEVFDATRLEVEEGFVADEITNTWWQGMEK